jgi:hypothetical protein
VSYSQYEDSVQVRSLALINYMIIDNKLKEIGIDKDIIIYLLNKTKHVDSIVDKALLHSVGYYGDYCIKLEMNSHWRKEITLHTNDRKIKKLRRELLINRLLD